MKKYEYARIARLAENLKKAEIDKNTINQIMQGGKAILKSTSPKKKAAWMKEAMGRMNKLLDKETRQAVREACACCLGGRRLKTVKDIAKRYVKLEDKIKAANETSVFGNSITLQKDGSIRVCFHPEDLPAYRCVCLPQAEEPLPILYCYCCGGHVKHHLQTALGRNLKCKVNSSALSSGGKKNCIFTLKII